MPGATLSRVENRQIIKDYYEQLLNCSCHQFLYNECNPYILAYKSRNFEQYFFSKRLLWVQLQPAAKYAWYLRYFCGSNHDVNRANHREWLN